MQEGLDSLQAKKIQLVGISYDKVDQLAKFTKRKKINFPLLSDPDSSTIKAFHLLNKEAHGIAIGVPYPGTFILDKQGTIRAKLFYQGYRRRHTSMDILQAIRNIR